MKYFSLPADFKHETIDKYDALNQKYGDDSAAKETYGQLTSANVLYSGRVIDVLPEIDYKKLENYLNHSRKRGIDFNYTLNPACMGNYEFSHQGVTEIKRLLRNLHNMGIEALTITIPALFEIVQATDMKFKIKASAISEIMSPDKALFYKNLGAHKVVVDPDITRNFKKLKNICRVFGPGVEIIINNVCYKNCPYKMYHYNHEAHRIPENTTQTVTDYYFNRCAIQKAGGVKNVMRLNWIRPEDLKYYEETGIQHFKIQGRQNILNGDPALALEAYMKEDFDGNLHDLITIFAPYTSFQSYMDNKKLDGFVKTFVNNPEFCEDACDVCGYCEGFSKKCMDPEKVAALNEEALAYFKETDKFTHLHTSETPEQPEKTVFQEDGLDFEFEA
jgi:Peptidase family U32